MKKEIRQLISVRGNTSVIVIYKDNKVSYIGTKLSLTKMEKPMTVRKTDKLIWCDYIQAKSIVYIGQSFVKKVIQKETVYAKLMKI